jgi:inositol hexakisphosphate/diphosphoinositol-pentakisphosphate kinase
MQLTFPRPFESLSTGMCSCYLSKSLLTVFYDRDGGPLIPKDVLDKVNKNLGIDLSAINFEEEKVEQIDDDTIMVGRKKIVKPFVEKPVNGEDHNIYIYYPKRMGGGVRRLFRKVQVQLL